MGEVTFYTKAGIDGHRLGACPFCQRVHMILFLKAKLGLLKYTVRLVNVARPPPEFRQLGLRHVPAVICEDESFDAVDDIVSFLDARFPTPSLTYDDSMVDVACKDYFSRFCYYIKQVAKDPSQLVAALEKLEKYLASRGMDGPKFLGGDSLTQVDCEVLPKLQHVRVAALSLKAFVIPTEFVYLWRYLYAAYAEEAFVHTCPCDQEIVLHWAEKLDAGHVGHDDKSRLCKDGPRFSFDVPAKAMPIQLE